MRLNEIMRGSEQTTLKNARRRTLGNTKEAIPTNDSGPMNDHYVPVIDGLRALAIGTVVAAHLGAGHFIPGGFGVTLFFFISGYLITSLMIREHDTFGRVSISSFYIRRFLRLAPALLLMVSIVSIVFFSLFGFVVLSQICAAVFYYMNYFLIFGGHEELPFGLLWSLAVEEHYYLVFPVIFMVGWKYPERFLSVLIASVIAVLCWRVVLVIVWHVGENRTYMASDARIDSILWGAILAILLNTKFLSAERYFEKWSVITLATVILLMTFLYRNNDFRETARYSLQGIALVPLFYATLFSEHLSIVRKILVTEPFVLTGKLSYSIYLWHMPVLFFFERFYPKDSGMGATIGKLVITVGLSIMSYYTVERYFQKLRTKFRATPPDTKLRLPSFPVHS